MGNWCTYSCCIAQYMYAMCDMFRYIFWHNMMQCRAFDFWGKLHKKYMNWIHNRVNSKWMTVGVFFWTFNIQLTDGWPINFLHQLPKVQGVPLAVSFLPLLNMMSRKLQFFFFLQFFFLFLLANFCKWKKFNLWKYAFPNCPPILPLIPIHVSKFT